ncbi:MAG: hypothetical protein CL674_02675 [Bdellovibrionaceae bacterium]|nr:hypothetical protein [Pseudobdellovibrionaceae bacterium]
MSLGLLLKFERIYMSKGIYMKNKQTQNETIQENRISTEQVQESLVRMFGANNVQTGSETQNHIGLQKTLMASVKVHDRAMLKACLNFAQQNSLSVYPISKGMNIGYGKATPNTNGQLLLDLSAMNRISSYDSSFSSIEIEPGVSQKDLYLYLKEQGNIHMADVTGASPDASILGNTMESGFGHTPLGDHRKNILNMEVMLPNGEIFNTGSFPSYGPDLSGIFVQANFGIVTKIKIPLFRRPEKVLSYVIKFKNEQDMYKALPKLRALRESRVIDSLIHFANPTRVLMSKQRFPEHLSPAQILSEKDCLELLNDSPLKVGFWSGLGGLYGDKDEIKLKKKKLKKQLGKHAQIAFFELKQLNFLRKVCHLPILKDLKLFKNMDLSLKSVIEFSGLLHGIPSSKASDNILWREKSMDELGIRWLCPVIPASEDQIKIFRQVTKEVFRKYSLELPMTLTMINHTQFICILNMNFNKNNPAELTHIDRAYKELYNEYKKLNFKPYRLGVKDTAEDIYDPIKTQILNEIKKAVDPSNMVAPKRYGIG